MANHGYTCQLLTANLLHRGILGEVTGLGMSWCWIRTSGSEGGNVTSGNHGNHMDMSGNHGNHMDGNHGDVVNCNYLLWNGKLLEVSAYFVVLVFYALLYERVSRATITIRCYLRQGK